MSEENTDTKAKVIEKFNEIKSNVQTFINDVNVSEIKASINSRMKEAQQDWNKLVDRDIADMKKKLQKEKAEFEKKAKQFLDGHKKELNALQAKLDKLVQASKKASTPAKKAPAKKPSIKKVVAKKAAATKKKKVSKK